MRLAPRDNFLHGHGHDSSTSLLGHPHVTVDYEDWQEARRILFADRPDSKIYQVNLSRRNLIYLLARFEQDGSASIIKPGGPRVYVESDHLHYAGRSPGDLSEESQAIVAEIEACLAMRDKREEA